MAERRKLVFDAELVGVKFGLLRPEEVDLSEISNAAFVEVVRRTEKPESLWRNVELRLQTMNRGECVHLLRYFPDQPVEEMVLQLSEGLKSSEEFCSMCESHNAKIQPLIVPLYHQLLKEHTWVDSNYLARALLHLSHSPSHLLQSVYQRVLLTAVELCPYALKLLSVATDSPDDAAKAALAHALERSNLDWFTTDDLLALVERFEQLGVSLGRECEKRLIDKLLLLLSSPLSYYSNRASALLRFLQKDRPEDKELTFLPNPPKENSSPLGQILRKASGKELSNFLASAPTFTLVKIMQLVQYRVVEREDILDIIQSRLHSLINPHLSQTEALDCCEVLGRLYTLNRIPRATVEKLAGAVQANPSWVTADTVVALAHQFSYATFNHAINKTICELIKESQAREVVSATAPDKGYYYQQGEMYHLPGNTVLNGLDPTQVAVLLISLLRGRGLDLKAQEIIKQYIKCLLPSFASLSVKHRSSLLLSASYRENFNVSLWNDLVRAVHAQEDCKFDTPTTLRSLAVYHTAATNVRNLLRNIPLSSEQPLELVLNGERLQDYSAATNPRRIRFS